MADPWHCAPWHHSPGYDLRRAPYDHPDFNSNALNEDLFSGSLTPVLQDETWQMISASAMLHGNNDKRIGVVVHSQRIRQLIRIVQLRNAPSARTIAQASSEPTPWCRDNPHARPNVAQVAYG